MKIEKITNAFVNEFDAQTQGCADDCKEYFGKVNANIRDQKKAQLRTYSTWDRTDCRNVIEAGCTYCYIGYTPKTSIYL